MRRPGIVAVNGTPTAPENMLSWNPGVVSCDIRYLRQNRVFEYKTQHPDATIIVRFEHPRDWHTDLEKTAVAYARKIAASWADIQQLDPLVIFAEEMNFFSANGETDPARQPLYESKQFYRAAGWWITRVAQIVNTLAPQMKLVAPPFAPGRHEDGTPDADGTISDTFAGYDFLADAVKKYFGNRVAVFAQWGDETGSHREQLQDPVQSVWYAFRWRRVLALFKKRYGIDVQIVISRAYNFATYDTDFFEQIAFFSQHTLNDARVLALAFYLWEDPAVDPTRIFNVWTQYIPDLRTFTQRLAALPDIQPGSLPPSDTIAAPPTPALPEQSSFGGMDIRVKFTDGHIKTMSLEEYLRGVVPAEIPATWHPEALKAQAIAARSYTANAIRRARYLQKPFDIRTDPNVDQNYRADKIHPATDKAILATKGLVMFYGRHPIDAVYSANCGGHTLNSETVFKKADGSPANPTPYLRGVTCPAPGPKNGHGVGLCQYGAQAMARSGNTFQQILSHYYTGISIAEWTYTPPATTAAETVGLTSPGNWQVKITRSPGIPIIVGNLADKSGITITAATPRGNTFEAQSGAKPEFGAGGFEFLVSDGAGTYRLAFAGQTFTVPHDGKSTVRLDIAPPQTPAIPAGNTLRGIVTDSSGQPLGGLTVRLQSAHTVQAFTTGADGVFSFDNLPAGTYDIAELGSGVSQTVLFDGKTPQSVALVIPATAPASGGTHWIAETTPLAGNIPLLVGDIGTAGETITVTAPSGAEITVRSGDKPEYGIGGFEVYAPETGTYTFRFLGRTVAVSGNGGIQKITFREVEPEEMARLISTTLPLSKIKSILTELKQTPDTANLFSIEEV